MSEDNNMPFKKPRGSRDAQAGSKANSTYTDPPRGRSDFKPSGKNASHPATEPISIPSRPLSRQDPRHHGQSPLPTEETIKSIPGLDSTNDERVKVDRWLRNDTMYGYVEGQSAESSGFGSRHSRSVSPKERGSLILKTPSNRTLSDVSNPAGTPAKLKSPKRDYPIPYDEQNLSEYEVKYVQEETWSKPNIYPMFAINLQRPQRGWTGILREDFFASEFERKYGGDFRTMAFGPSRLNEIFDVMQDNFEKHLKATDTKKWTTSGEATGFGSTMRFGSSPGDPGDAFTNKLDDRLRRAQTGPHRTASAGVNSNIASPLGSTRAPSVESPPASLRTSKARSSSNASQSSQHADTSKPKGYEPAKVNPTAKSSADITKTTSAALAPIGIKSNAQASSVTRGSSTTKNLLTVSKPPKVSLLQAEVDTHSATARPGDLSPPRARTGPAIADDLRSTIAPASRGKQKPVRGRGSDTRGGRS